MSSSLAPAAQNTQKRDFLIKIEQNAQLRWQNEKLFESNSPYSTGEIKIPIKDFELNAELVRQHTPKFFGTFPYPVSLIIYIKLLSPSLPSFNSLNLILMK